MAGKQFSNIDIMINHGISKQFINKLKKANYYTVEQIAYSLPKQLVQIKGINAQKAENLHETACQYLSSSMTFTTAKVLKEKQTDNLKITTGSTNFDTILGGGIETGTITEIYGTSGSGKTQICLMLCITCQLEKRHGGAEGCALWIDTEGTFRPERIQVMAQEYGLDSDDVLDNISFARAYNSDLQSKLISEAAQMMTKTHYALVIVDSATALFRSEYIGRRELAVRQQTLNQFLRELQKLCDIFSVAVVITNQVVSDPSGMSFGPNTKPIGGNIIAHASTTRISLRKGCLNTRISKIIKSPHLAVEESIFQITKAGITDL
eukprot:26195_1